MADKVITQVPVTIDDLVSTGIYYAIPEALMQADVEPEVAPQPTIQCSASYIVRDSTGQQIGTHHNCILALTQAEASQLNGFLHATVLPGINRAEGTA